MKHIETNTMIHAPAEKVWKVLMDFGNYPRWNPFIKSIEGDKMKGGKLKVRMQPPGESTMIFKPRVLTLDKLREFRWKGHLLIPGIFDGEHYFKLFEPGPNTVKFIHGENFKGFLVGALTKKLEKTREGFVQMNKALKRECEIKLEEDPILNTKTYHTQ